MLHHQKADDGNAKLADGAAPHLPVVDSMDDWHYLMQLNQAQAVAFGIEYYRSLRPHCMGAIVWQLNDCWPVTSWAAIDGDGRRKLLWYALRRVYAERLATVQPEGDGRAVRLLNDSVTAATGPLSIGRCDLDGRLLADDKRSIEVGAGSQATVSIPESIATPGHAAGELLVVEWAGQRVVYPFLEDIQMQYPLAAFEATAQPTDGGVAVRVVAQTMVRHLTLLSDRVDPDSVVDSQLIDLLPGEEHTFHVRTTVSASDPGWTQAPTLRALNDLS